MRIRKQRQAPPYAFAWLVVAAIVCVGVVLDAAAFLIDVRRDKYLLDHRCRLVNYSGARADHLYECDAGLIRERDI